MSHFQTSLEDGILTVIFNAEKKSVNTFNEEAIKELDDLTSSIADNPPEKGVVFKSAKSTFIVGADIGDFVKLFDQPETKVAEVVRAGQRIFNRIEDLPVPTVALIAGTALGGGFELALACDYRVAADASFQMGLPEIKLGLIPAWGGTTRLPRLIGVDNAIELICAGKTVSPKEALKYKMVDLVVAPDKMEDAAKNFIGLGEQYKKARQSKLGPIKLGWVEWLMAFRLAEGQVSAKAGKNYPAPVKALYVMRDGKKLNRDEALTFEVGAFVELFSGKTARNLISVFNTDQAVKATNKKFVDNNPVGPIKKVGVIGAGVMGRGIAAYTAGKKLNVKVYDQNAESLEKCFSEAKDYQMSKVGKGYITIEEAMDVMSKLKLANSIDELADSDLIIEAIYENFDAKVYTLREAFYQTSAFREKHPEPIPPDAILATNTSSISIDKLSGYFGSECFCGIHFFNPVNKMPLVEIVRGKKTSDATIARALSYVNSIGKTPVVVKDCNGFLVNRLLFPYLAAFDNLVAEGVDFQQIDKVMESWGWPLGPASLSDLIGIDIIYHAADVMKKAYPDRVKFDMDKGPTAQLATSKNYGQKTGKGWYNWSYKNGTYKKGAINWKLGLERPESEIINRMMSPMVTEAKIILEEGIVPSWNEINVGLIYGAGFPSFRGGLDKI